MRRINKMNDEDVQQELSILSTLNIVFVGRKPFWQLFLSILEKFKT